jgi:Ca2+-transporting ATPase
MGPVPILWANLIAGSVLCACMSVCVLGEIASNSRGVCVWIAEIAQCDRVDVCVTDIPPAMALGVDPPAKNVMNRPPRDPARGIFSPIAVVQLVVYALSMAAVSLGVFAIAIYTFDESVPSDFLAANRPRSLAFVSLVSTQLAHSFVVHAGDDSIVSREFVSNRWLLGAIGVSFGLLVVACYIPGLNDVLQQYPLTASDWGQIALCVLAHLIFAETFKFVFRKQIAR